MVNITHGGDIYSARECYPGTILDFSANINPLGLPDGVREALTTCSSACEHYPDPLCRTLTREIANTEAVAENWIQCGNGAADLIFRYAFAAKPRHALLAAPTFAEYEQALRAVDCAVSLHALNEQEGFRLTRSILERITDELDVLILCNPNNPTGHIIDPALLQEILSGCRAHGVTLMVDECFLDFLDDPQQHTLIRDLSSFPNLLLLRAFTKIYAMPGLRLGYVLCADSSLLQQMQACAQPWSVGVPAQLAGVQALCESEYRRQTKELVTKERGRLKAGLTELGFQVIGGDANFIFFRAVGRSDLQVRLQLRGILIRSCANYHGLSGEYYRIAVRRTEENACLLAALEEYMDGLPPGS